MLRNKVVWDKHYYSNRFTVRNIFLLRYSRFRLMCTFNIIHSYFEIISKQIEIKRALCMYMLTVLRKSMVGMSSQEDSG